MDWTKIKSTCNSAWNSVKTNLTLILLSFVMVISVLWFFDRKKINRLSAEIEILVARQKLQQMAASNSIAINEIAQLAEQDEKIKKEIEKIDLDARSAFVSAEMSADEIVNAFKRIYSK